MAELKDLLHLQDVTQAKLAERLETRSLRQFLMHQPGHGVTDEDLAAVGRVEQASQTIETPSEIVTVARFRCPSVECHPHARRLIRECPRLGSERSLRV